MTRRLAAGVAGALLGVALAGACGKYGPPERARAPSAPRADAVGESAQPGSTSAPEPTPARSSERDSEPDEAPR